MIRRARARERCSKYRALPFASDDLQGLESAPPPTGTSCHQESSDAPSSRWRPSLGPLTALGAATLLLLHIPPAERRFSVLFFIYSFLCFSLWGPCFLFFSILYEMVFRGPSSLSFFWDIFPLSLSLLAPFFTRGFLHKIAIHKCRRCGCLKLFAGMTCVCVRWWVRWRALSLRQMLKNLSFIIWH